MERKTISRRVNSSPLGFSSSAAETVADIEELLTEILLCVPARSVVRLKCISKHWFSLISNPEFRHRHTLRNPNPKVSAFFSHTTQDFTFISLHKNPSGSFPPRHFVQDLHPGNHERSINPFKSLNIFNSFVQGDRNGFGLKILQSCNGLFLCIPFSTHKRRHYHSIYFGNPTSQYHSIYVVNPTSNQFLALSPPRAGKSTEFVRYALAFDPSKSPHYKVVCLSTTRKHNWVHQVDVYSSETRSWRLLETPYASRDLDMHLDGRSREGGVYCNGAIHWIRDETELPIRVGEDGNSLVRENADLVHYYDIAEERLGLAIPSAPLVVTGNYPPKFPKFDHRYFGESGDHLYLIDVYKDSSSKNNIYKDCNAEFDVMEMGKDYSGWFVKYHVDLNPVVAAFRGNYDHFSRFYVLFLGGEGKEEQDQQQQQEVSSSLLFHVPGHSSPSIAEAVSYETRQRNQRSKMSNTDQTTYRRDGRRS